MIDHDDAQQDSIACLALGILPDVEAQMLASHVSACADCRQTYARMRATADLVGYQEEALLVDDVAQFRLKSRIMKSIRATVLEPMSIARSNGSAVTDAMQPNRVWLAWGFAAAAAIVAGVTAFSNTSLRAENANLATRAAQQANVAAAAASQARELDRRLAAIVAPGSKHFAVPSGEVVASNGRLIIALHDLPALPAGKTYQAWTRKRGAKSMTPGATFGPDPAGVAFVDIPVSESMSAIAVSVEPSAGSSAPTSKPTFVRTLT